MYWIAIYQEDFELRVDLQFDMELNKYKSGWPHYIMCTLNSYYTLILSAFSCPPAVPPPIPSSMQDSHPQEVWGKGKNPLHTSELSSYHQLAYVREWAVNSGGREH